MVLTRWILALQEYNLIIENVPGKSQVVADALFRGRADIQGAQSKEIQIRLLREQLRQVDTGLRALAVQLKEKIREDGRLQKVVQELETDVCRNFMKEKFVLKEDYLFQNVSTTGAKWVLKKVVEFLHKECGHYGVTKTVKYIQRFCNFKDMHRIVAQVIRCCLLCAQTKVPLWKYNGLMGHVLANEPLEIVCVLICLALFQLVGWGLNIFLL
ncbi:hypothetical protein PR048_005084 [Dryococelus australis]|uniref:RNA-directed DNA polymerase n=1 Tax=Dryococelus australis TaxID=614101 RepID=A0ABQ9I779_9NEOP|nr:hypothetical protein PR048_005084 [Dryococelus australis]